MAAVVALACLLPGTASALPAGSEYPATWTIVNPTTATAVTPSGITVTATLSAPSSGTLVWQGPSGQLVATGPVPAYMPATTTQALKPAITGCSAAPCGSVTFTFSRPVLSPSMLVADMGAQQGGASLTTYHDHPITSASGGTFALDSAGSQSAGMSIQAGGTAVGIANPGGYIGQPATANSCSASATSGFGCGAYNLQLPSGAAPVTSVRLNFGYAGTGTTNDTFGLMLPAIPQEPALSVVKTATPGSITRAGEQVTYSFLVRNTGNVPMTGISVADTFTAPQSGSAGAVSCPQATLDVGASMTCTAPAYTATQADVDAGQINNSATATGTPPLGPPVDSPPSTARVTIPATPAIDIAKSADVSTFAAPGTPVTYSYLVRNTGNVTLDPVVVTDPMPGLSAITCPQTRLAPGAAQTCTARYATTAADVTAGSARNTATATGTPPSGPPISRTSTVTIPYSPVADLAIVKRATSNRLVPGRRLTYELTVTNNGPSPASDVRVSDPLPSGLTFVSASRGCTFASGTVTCTLDSLAAGSSATFQVMTRVASSVADSVTNTATVESPTRDPNPGNNRDRTTVPSGPETDLAIAKTASVDSITVGGQLFYTLLVRNNGPSDATGVTVNDVAPAGLTLLSARGSQGRCTVAATSLTCNLGRLAAGGTAQVLVSARVDASGDLVNTAAVDGDQPDPNPGNNRDQRRVTGRNPPPSLAQPADLEIVKTSNRRAAVGAQTITYTLRVTNLGPGTANGVQVIDTPSLPIRVVSVRTSAGSCSRTVPIRCDLGTLNVGARATITVVARPMAPGTLRNSASVTGDVPDPNAGNNIDGVATKVRGLLKIRKTASRTTLRAGGTLRYRITVTNASAFALRSVRTCDRLPSGLVYVASNPRARLSRGQGCWTLRTLGAGRSKSYVITARALRGTAGTKVNTAVATAPGATSRRATRTVRVLAGQVRSGGVTG